MLRATLEGPGRREQWLDITALNLVNKPRKQAGWDNSRTGEL